MRIGQGFDVHPLADPDERRPLVLGGVEVSATGGLRGHSDADVLTHAVVDALLGAVGAGDLGGRFGVDEPELAGADSLGLLRDVVAELGGAGWTLGNLDATVVAERPRLAPHRAAIRASLAEALGVDVADVSVKFSTADRLGSLGRGEGVAALASCLLVPAQR